MFERLEINECAEPFRLASKIDVLRNRHLPNWREFLCNDGDPVYQRFIRGFEIDGNALDPDVAAVSAQQPHGDV
ncbi:hypothetical protein D3C87_1633310 [compost metagenome]